MIISFEIDAEELCLLGCEFLEDRVSAVLRSHRLGHNLAIFNRVTASWLLNKINLINRDRATLVRIQQQAAQTGDLVRRSPYHIKVRAPGLPFEAKDNGRFIQLPLDHAAFDDIVRRPALVVEDVVIDLAIFQFVFKNIPSTMASLPVAYEAVHGGGGRIWEVVKLKAQERRIVVAVGDSDKNSPVTSSAKSDQVDILIKDVQWPLIFCSFTPGSEIENIFGLEVLATLPRIASSSSHLVLTKIESAERDLGHDSADRFQWYFDMKSGVSEKTLSKIKEDAVKQWFELKLSLAQTTKPITNIPGFGDKLSKELLSSDECLSAFRRTVRSKEWLEVFGGFISNIMWQLAAPAAQRT